MVKGLIVKELSISSFYYSLDHVRLLCSRKELRQGNFLESATLYLRETVSEPPLVNI